MRIAVFIDYWNFQLTLNEKLSKKHSATDYKSKIEWGTVGKTLSGVACNVLSCDVAQLSYEGSYIYTSYDPNTDHGRKYKRWVNNWLDRQPGINVRLRERKPKAPPKCPTCHQTITHCPHKGCGEPIRGTIEKGVDTYLVTDLIRLAMNNSYDSAVVVSLDADIIPAVEYIQSTGKKIIQAGFPPHGSNLANKCWGSFDILAIENLICTRHDA